jgi:hypothetical protein
MKIYNINDDTFVSVFLLASGKVSFLNMDNTQFP